MKEERKGRRKRRTNKVDKVFELLVEAEGDEGEDVVLLIADHIGDKRSTFLVHEFISTERDDTRLGRSWLEESPDPITQTWRWGWGALLDMRLLRKLLHPKGANVERPVRKSGLTKEKKERGCGKGKKKESGKGNVRPKGGTVPPQRRGSCVSSADLILNSPSPFFLFFSFGFFVCTCVSRLSRSALC